MGKKVLFLVFALAIGLVITGCGSKQQAGTGYVNYNPQQQQQQVPVSGGCGVVAPADVSPPAEVPVDSAL